MEDGEIARVHRSATAETQAEPHPAATLALVRPGRRGREVLLLRRPLSSAFAPDAWVFPGGRLDAADLHFPHGRLSAGPTPATWAGKMSIIDPVEAAAYPVAAIRETWEETGILISACAPPAAECDAGRRDLLAERRSLAEYLEAANVRIATGRLHYFAHWITPARFPRRFDTRFFVAEVTGDARCELVGDELTDFRWLPPEAALEAEGRGEMRMLPPTIDTLERLAHRAI